MSSDEETRAARLDVLLKTFPGGGRALAERIGVSQQQVSRWRNARDGVSWERAKQIAPVLGTTPGALYAGDPNWVPPHERTTQPLDAEGKAVPTRAELDALRLRVAELEAWRDRIDQDALAQAHQGIEEIADDHERETRESRRRSGRG